MLLWHHKHILLVVESNISNLFPSFTVYRVLNSLQQQCIQHTILYILTLQDDQSQGPHHSLSIVWQIHPNHKWCAETKQLNKQKNPTKVIQRILYNTEIQYRITSKRFFSNCGDSSSQRSNKRIISAHGVFVGWLPGRISWLEN